MKVILIGATGTVGSIVLATLLQNREIEVITVSRTGKTDLHADISDPDAVAKLFGATGSFDALINVAGDCWIGPFDEMTEDSWYTGIRSKLMGQINLVMMGKAYINEGGSFTLTSGFLSDDPVKGTINYSVVNGGIDNFVLAAATELSRGIRINAVSPGLVLPAGHKGMYAATPGQYPVSHDRVAYAYYKSAFGYLTGQVFRVWEPSTQYLRK
ncbi:short chain dehydrogenase [Deminuibacter soli]|uniref:Short chain dehydrogenase n=1 Tax=Deminuibacter soli TaxID=2291815 RepID=A0A3E1NHI1_9BACT|nr:short chain dehydrogenase [Deminuibacter soli]RFM27342.1 short chain dehydrogenase [Deminuibacter soli]